LGIGDGTFANSQSAIRNPQSEFRNASSNIHFVLRRLHYAWVIAAVTFVILLITAGVRATPGILMVPLEEEFGWSRAVISGAVAINIALFGLIGPFAASVMDRWGLRRVVLGALALLTVSVALTSVMRTQWQLTLLWGFLVGSGPGVTSMVLAAVIATRWFEERRGLVVGALSAANATGQLSCFRCWPASSIGTGGVPRRSRCPLPQRSCSCW
jgi:MFS family permease